MQLAQLMPMLTARAVVVGLIGGSFAILANIISFAMIDKINKRSPETEQISYFWWGTEVRKKFKQLYPESRLTLMLDLCVVLMAISGLVLLRVWVFS